jgi:hypothetical protein
MAALAANGVTKADAVAPMKAHVAMRGPEMNGAKEGTPELNFGDPDGIVCQIQDASYCGGAGPLGSVCGAAEDVAEERPDGAARLQPPHDLFHRLGAHEQVLHGSVRASRSAPIQGPTAPTLAVGPTVEFLMFTGGGGPPRAGAPPRAASINHACMNMDGSSRMTS